MLGLSEQKPIHEPFGTSNMKPYCTQNNGDCASCSLSSYGRDCQNIRIITAHKGGRTERISVRATKETRSEFLKLGISAGDLFEQAVANYDNA